MINTDWVTSGHTLFAQLQLHAQQTPTLVALSDDTTQLSYRDLLERLNQQQAELTRLKAQRVGIQADNSIDWAVLDLALLFSGRTCVPLPTFFSSAQTQHSVRAAGVDTLFATGALQPQQLQLANAPYLHANTCKVSFTSGSTGHPKGVCLDADTLLATTQAVVSSVASSCTIQRHLSVLPLSLLLENTAGLYANLWQGSTVALPSAASLGLGGSSQLNPMQFAASQIKQAPDSMILVPQLLLALVNIAEAGFTLPDSYQFLAVGGAKIAPSLLERATAQGLPVYEGYGLTECGSVLAINLPQANKPGTVGRPLPHVELEVIDGVVVVHKPTMLGYLGQSALADAVHTQDTGQLDNGFVALGGRQDNVITTSFGRNLAPEWVESELQAELSIGLACVFGDGQPTNGAMICPRGDVSDADIETAITRCNERLPDYARISRWWSQSMAELQAADCLSPTGKPRRAQIAQTYATNIADLFTWESTHKEQHHDTV